MASLFPFVGTLVILFKAAVANEKTANLVQKDGLAVEAIQPFSMKYEPGSRTFYMYRKMLACVFGSPSGAPSMVQKIMKLVWRTGRGWRPFLFCPRVFAFLTA